MKKNLVLILQGGKFCKVDLIAPSTAKEVSGERIEYPPTWIPLLENPTFVWWNWANRFEFWNIYNPLVSLQYCAF